MERIIATRRRPRKYFRWNANNTELLTPTDVEEPYSNTIFMQSSQHTLMNGVKYLLYLPSELEMSTNWTKLTLINFSEGATFVKMKELREHLPRLLDLFASFVRYDSKDIRRIHRKKDPGVYIKLPSMILDMAFIL